MAHSPKKLFELDVIKRLDKAEKLLTPPFAGMRRIIKRDGAVKAAKKFVDSKKMGKLSEGLMRLVEANLPHLTIEQAVIDFQKKKLFSDRDVLVAKAHLIMAKMLSKKEESKTKPHMGGSNVVVPFGTGTDVA
jgi:hypothetical protein